MQDNDGDFEQDIVRSFRSINQSSHFEEVTKCPSLQRAASQRRQGGRDRFEGFETSTKSKSLERLPSYRSRERELELVLQSNTTTTTTSAGRKYAGSSPKLSETPTAESDFQSARPLGKPVQFQIMGTDVAAASSAPKSTMLSSLNTYMGGAQSKRPPFKSSASSLCSLGERVDVKNVGRAWEEPVLCHGDRAAGDAKKLSSTSYNDSEGYVKVDNLEGNKPLSRC